MKKKQRFLCNKCKNMTRFIKKSRMIDKGVKHDFAQCEKCKTKHTIFVTDSYVKELLKQQKHTTVGAEKIVLANRINEAVEELKRKYQV